MNKTFFLAGGTSDVGERVAAGIVQHYGKEKLTCLVRDTSDTRKLKELGVRLVTGDVVVPATFQTELRADVIYIDMTHPKHYHKSVDVVIAAGVNRAFFVTTTGIFSRYRSAAAIYIEGEERIKKSGIQYTILRPSMIYGTDRDRNMTKLLRFLEKWPFFPVFGEGKALMQPVYVQDLADGILSAILLEEQTVNQSYNLCGPTPITYLQLLREACDALGTHPRFLHIPHGLAASLASIAENVPGFPVTHEQVLRLVEDKSFDIGNTVRDLKYHARPFSEGIREEVDCLRRKGLLKKVGMT